MTCSVVPRLLEEVTLDQGISRVPVQLVQSSVGAREQILQLVRILEDFGLNLAISLHIVLLAVDLLVDLGFAIESWLSHLRGLDVTEVCLFAQLLALDFVEFELLHIVVDWIIFLTKLALVTHELDQVRLEEVHTLWPSLFASQILIVLLLLLLRLLGRLAFSWDALREGPIHGVIDTVAVEQEHPLVHLEVLDVQLGHEFNDFDTLDRKPVVAPLCRTHIEDAHELRKQVWPKFFECASQPIRIQAKHDNPRK